MPQLFKNAVMTLKGQELLTKAQSDGIKIKFTKMGIGNGSYQEEEKGRDRLEAVEGLKELKHKYDISSISAQNKTTVKLTALLSNYDSVGQSEIVQEGFYINEVGVYAKQDDLESEEILYAIAVTETDQGDFMPKYNGTSPAQIIQDFFVTVANGEETTVEVTNGAFALQVTADALRADVTELQDFAKEKGEQAYSHAVTKKGSAFESGLYKITTNEEGHVTTATAVEKTDITKLGISAAEHTHQKLSIKLNGGSPTEYNGGEAKEVNITPANIGARAVADSNIKLYYTLQQMDPSWTWENFNYETARSRFAPFILSTIIWGNDADKAYPRNVIPVKAAGVLTYYCFSARVSATYISDGRRMWFGGVGNITSDNNKSYMLTWTEVSKSNTADSTVTFTSADLTDNSVTTSTGWTSVEQLTTGETHATLFGKISQMFKNVRYLWKMVSALQSDRKCVNFSLTKNSSYTFTQDYTRCFYSPLTGQVHIFINTYVSGATGGVSLFYVPEKYRPKSDAFGICAIVREGGIFASGRGIVMTSGDIRQIVTSMELQQVTFSIDYYI